MSKRSLTEEKAFSECDTLIQKVGEVTSELQSAKADAESLDSLTHKIVACAAVRDFQQMLRDSSKPEATEKVSALDKSVDALLAAIGPFREASEKGLPKLLQDLWLNTTDLPLKLTQEKLDCLWQTAIQGQMLFPHCIGHILHWPEDTHILYITY